MKIGKEFDKWLKDHNMTYEEHLELSKYESAEFLAGVRDYECLRVALTTASTLETAQKNYNEYVARGMARPREIDSSSLGGSSILLGPVIGEESE